MLIKHKTHFGGREVWISDSWEEFESLCLRHLKSFVEKTKGMRGLSFGSFIWVESYKNIPVLVHECIHAIDGIMTSMVISNDTEVRAYLVDALIESVIAKTKTNKGKK